MIVLALNAGSSSLKFALFDVAGGAELELARGGIPCTDVLEAGAAVFKALEGAPPPRAVGHRLVHGGPQHDVPEIIDARLRRDLEHAVPFSPLHLPRSLALIDSVSARYGDLPQVACFDTAFHRTLPEIARCFPLPQGLRDLGIRRYGFHGLSYEYIVQTLGPERLGRAVLAHLGSGSSLVAIRNGQAVDTTMGLTPSGGTMMGTRCGDIDPGLLVYLMDHLGYDAGKIDALVNRESGLLGVSGTTSDMKTLLDASTHDARAELAVEMFCYSARKFIGAYAAALGGIDTLVFTGGIGEHAAAVRTRICAGLAHLGIELDEVLNVRNDESIGLRNDRCQVLVVRTDEERTIARHTMSTTSRHHDGRDHDTRIIRVQASNPHTIHPGARCTRGHA
ncbi:acetate/propionate family kinase [Pendulispora brunnea]|uniref:Acetate kinase n=1 Tax=Pendulispora brunnea TaxID=2905690 RepID=A0ABZ2JZ07_9BACT